MHLRCLTPLSVKWAPTGGYISIRCRKCRGCLLVRQYIWIVRAAHEQAFAKRTWFVTLTFRPAERSSAMSRASALGGEKSAQNRLVRASGIAVSRYFKRLRKSGFALRYLCVPELHRDGFPHWHGLVHDLSGNLTWKDLSHGWTSGFSVCKLVKDEKAIRYVTKYLSKDTHGRVRASLRYGESELDREMKASAIGPMAAPPAGEGFDAPPKVAREPSP